MKLSRTKAQEIANIFWPGKYIVEDVDGFITGYLRQMLATGLAEDYVEVIIRYICGEELSAVDRQKKYHAMQNLPVACADAAKVAPTMLEEVNYSQDRQWTLPEIATVLFGKYGDTRVYAVPMPTPVDGKLYTTKEVEKIRDDFFSGG